MKKWIRMTALALAALLALAGCGKKQEPAGDRLAQIQQKGELVIALHIKVGFGLNISTITQSITHRVKDEVEHATGLKVARIDVYVDDIIDL